MNTRTINGAGKIFYQTDFEDQQSSRITRKFLVNSGIEFVKRCITYHRLLTDLPFISSERQIHSILMPAFSKNSDIALMEQPINRSKCAEEYKAGWLDYWIMKNDTVFLIEIKHSLCSYKSKNINSSTIEKWQTGISQINISKKERQYICPDVKNIVRICLMILPFYEKIENKDDAVLSSTENIKELLITANTQFIDSPNFSLLWHLPEKLYIGNEYNDDESLMHYPALGIFAKVIFS